MSDLDRSLPPLASLVAFEAAHRLGSFTHAAAELGVSQATVSRRVRELEADLGSVLFERRRHDVAATDAGDRFADSVRSALGELGAAADAIRRPAAGGTFTVLSSLSFAAELVAPALATLQQRHPGLSIRLLSSCEPIERCLDPFDVALQYGPPESRRFDVDFVASEAVVPVCSPALLDRIGSPPDFGDVALLDVDDDDPGWVDWRAVLTHLGHPPADDWRPAQSFTSYQVALDAAEAGAGVALGWERSIGSRLSTGRLVTVPGVRLDDVVAIHRYVPAGRPTHPSVEEWMGLVADAVRRSSDVPRTPGVDV